MILPKPFIEAIKAVPKKDLDKVCMMCKFEYKGSKMTTQALIEIFEKGDIVALRGFYKSIAPALLLGGMLPGVGLACNIIDATLCFALGLWLDFAIDVIAISLFEVPGVSGLKSISKGMLGLCKSVKIDVKAFWKIMDKVSQCNKIKESMIHELFSQMMSSSNSFLRFVDVQAIARSIPSQNLFKWGNGVLAKIASECEACGAKIATKY